MSTTNELTAISQDADNVASKIQQLETNVLNFVNQVNGLTTEVSGLFSTVGGIFDNVAESLA